jgi:hypothetical protein
LATLPPIRLQPITPMNVPKMIQVGPSLYLMK